MRKIFQHKICRERKIFQHEICCERKIYPVSLSMACQAES